MQPQIKQVLIVTAAVSVPQNVQTVSMYDQKVITLDKEPM